MKRRTILQSFVGVCLGLRAKAFTLAQTPTKLFDVRNGNGIVDGANTQAFATYIAYKDSASKNKIIDAFADAYGYQATINDAPNSQSKQQFYNAKLTAYIRDVYRAQQIGAAEKVARDSASTTADGELPPQGIR